MPDFRQQMIVPILRYRNVGSAIDWLQSVFGFAVHARVTDAGGAIVYAQLRLGECVLMVGRVDDSAISAIMLQPDEIGGVETQVCYLRVTDPDVVRARADASGAEIILDYHGGGDASPCFACRDPEGHVWNFGSFDPRSGDPRPVQKTDRRRSRALQAALGVALGANLLAFAGLVAQTLPGSERAPWQLRHVAVKAHAAGTVDEVRSAGADTVLAPDATHRPPDRIVAEIIRQQQIAPPHTELQQTNVPLPPYVPHSLTLLPADDSRGPPEIIVAVAGQTLPSVATPDHETTADPHTALPDRSSVDNHVSQCASSRDPDLRLRACSAIIARGGNMAWAYNNRGAAYFSKGQSYRAVDNFTLALALDARLTEAYVNRGLAYAHRHDFARAIADQTAAIALDPGHAQAHAHRALALIASNRAGEALPDAARLLAMPLDSATLLQKRARILAAVGNHRGGAAELVQHTKPPASGLLRTAEQQ